MHFVRQLQCQRDYKKNDGPYTDTYTHFVCVEILRPSLAERIVGKGIFDDLIWCSTHPRIGLRHDDSHAAGSVGIEIFVATGCTTHRRTAEQQYQTSVRGIHPRRLTT